MHIIDNYCVVPENNCISQKQRSWEINCPARMVSSCVVRVDTAIVIKAPYHIHSHITHIHAYSIVCLFGLAECIVLPPSAILILLAPVSHTPINATHLACKTQYLEKGYLHLRDFAHHVKTIAEIYIFVFVYN